MFLAPVRVLEVSPPRPRKKQRIASHRVSPPTPASASPLLSSSTFFHYRGWNRRENINFSVFRPTYVFLFLSLLSSVGFPRSWLCHLVPDGTLFPFFLSSPDPHHPLSQTLRSRRFPRLWAWAHAMYSYPSSFFNHLSFTVRDRA